MWSSRFVHTDDDRPYAVPFEMRIASSMSAKVMIGETAIDGTIEDLLAGEHAVMVYESDEAMDAIACGNVGGALTGNTLVTGLGQAGMSGHIGFALFPSEGDQTLVQVVLGHGLAPISASGANTGEDHMDEDHAMQNDMEDGYAAATPEA